AGCSTQHLRRLTVSPLICFAGLSHAAPGTASHWSHSVFARDPDRSVSMQSVVAGPVRRSLRQLAALPNDVARKRMADQDIHQIGLRQAARLPELGIHADRG